VIVGNGQKFIYMFKSNSSICIGLLPYKKATYNRIKGQIAIEGRDAERL
jgi:hypothetical protein